MVHSAYFISFPHFKKHFVLFKEIRLIAWTINKPSFLTQTLSKKCSELTKEMVYWQIRQSGRVGLSLILQLLNFQYLWVEQHFMEHRTNPNIIFWTSNKLECAHLLMIEIEHSIFGFQRTNIEPNKVFTRFIKLHMKLTRTSFFWILNESKHIHLFVMEFKHPIFGFERLNIELPT